MQSATKATPQSDAPNVLFVCADDLNGWIGPIGRYPGRIHTPHMDRLAATGTTLTHTYCTAPHCNPSRASVFTGLRPTSTGVYLNERLPEDRPLPTLPEFFRGAGYEVFGAGKVFHGQFDYATATRARADVAHWMDSHNRPEAWQEFHPCEDEPLPAMRPLNGFFDPQDPDAIPPAYHHFDWGAMPTGMAGERASLPDERVTDHADAFLRRDHGHPFFCAVGFYRPHLPWYVPQEYFDLYPLDEIELPFVTEHDLDQVPPIARRWARTPADDHALVTRHGQWRHAIQGYLASISFCDALLGRLLDTLDQTGLSDSTHVVLWGDNGFHLGEKLHWRKFTLWEEATRVPLLIRAPGHSQPGHRTSQPASLLDLTPTLLELAGQEVPQLAPDGAPLEGESLVPLLAADPPTRYSLPISTWEEGNHSVRSPDWRYTRYVDGTEELYDHRNDPAERHNLASSPELQYVVEAHRRYLEAALSGDSDAAGLLPMPEVPPDTNAEAIDRVRI